MFKASVPCVVLLLNLPNCVFLVADEQAYKRLCSTVGPFVHWSVRNSRVEKCACIDNEIPVVYRSCNNEIPVVLK